MCEKRKLINKNVKPSSVELLRIVLDNLPIRIFWKDTESIFLGANQRLIDDLQVESLEKLIGTSDVDYFDIKEQVEHFRKDDQQVMQSGVPKIGIEEPLTLVGQPTKWLRTTKVPLLDEGGELIGMLGTYEDITEQINYREKIEEQAQIDSLTGLANRRKLQNTVSSYSGDRAGLFFIDLDYFKIVNDSLGHSVGDNLLRLVADRLNQVVSPTGGLVVRLGGDEFSVFLPLEGEQSDELILQDIATRIIISFESPFSTDNHVLKITASIGITVMNSLDFDYSQAFCEADIAMYRAKEIGRGGFQFYNDDMKEKAQRKLLLNLYLRQAIEKKELSLMYQPQIDKDDKLIGVEALLRWQSEELGSVAPSEFIATAEETGLIHTIGTWVYETALNDLKHWQPYLDKLAGFKLAINFSAKQFQNDQLSHAFVNAINIRDLSPSSIQIEITESLLMDKECQAIQTMLKFQNLGISIAIDDFGTGYSSLSYLANLPIDKLKIDRSFVVDLNKNTTNTKLVSTLINMAKNLQMEVIAEGVENQEEKTALLSLGCHQFQGYLFSHPVCADELLANFIKR
jgi:diguanylate cyclase (GGDEF)-like protein